MATEIGGGQAGGGAGPSPFLGIGYPSPEAALVGATAQQAVANLRELGAGMLRIEITCNARLAAPLRGPGEPDAVPFEQIYDPLVATLNAAGVDVLALIDNLSVAADLTTINDEPDLPDGTNPYIRALARVAGQVAMRYNGGPHGRLAAIELFNEPNSVYELWKRAQQRMVDPDRFAALLTAVANYVRVGAPGVQIVTGGLLSMPPSPEPLQQPAAYLAGVIRSPYLRPDDSQGAWPWDAAGIHPYGYPPNLHTAQATGELDKLAAVLDTAVAKGLPPSPTVPPATQWVTEVGYSVCTDLRPPIDPATQAAYLTAAVEQARAQGSVGRFLVFTFHDFGTSPCHGSWGNQMGLCVVSPHTQVIATRRPAFDVYRAFVAAEAASQGPAPTEV